MEFGDTAGRKSALRASGSSLPQEVYESFGLAAVRAWVAEAGLTLHPEKTRIVDATLRGGFDFLGYHFERGLRWLREKSLKKLKERVRAKTLRTDGRRLWSIVADVTRPSGSEGGPGFIPGSYHYRRLARDLEFITFRNSDSTPRLGSTPVPSVAGRALAASTISRHRCFPQWRGKQHPERARSPFHFGFQG